MKDAVLVVFFVTTIVFALATGAALDRLLLQGNELDAVYRKIDAVCGIYDTLIHDLKDKVDAEKVKLIKYRNKNRKRRKR